MIPYKNSHRGFYILKKKLDELKNRFQNIAGSILNVLSGTCNSKSIPY